MASNRASPPRRFAVRLSTRPFVLALAFIVVLAGSARAQLDLGSPEIPREEIDGYLRPFYRLVSTAAGSDRFLPPPRPRLGWDAGIDAVLVPIPEGPPFDRVDLSALPLFRAGLGLEAFGAGVSGRGLIWRDPRVGDLATFGGCLGYGRGVLPALFPLTLSLSGAWDYLSFSSDYVYHYRGSPLGLADRDVPGDYTLKEHVFGLGASVYLPRGPWGASLQGWYEWASARFRYLYYSPQSDRRETLLSRLDVPGFRGAMGLSWRGLRLEAGIRSFPYMALGWAWER